jgi:hypothetical protein
MDIEYINFGKLKYPQNYPHLNELLLRSFFTCIGVRIAFLGIVVRLGAVRICSPMWLNIGAIFSRMAPYRVTA